MSKQPNKRKGMKEYNPHPPLPPQKTLEYGDQLTRCSDLQQRPETHVSEHPPEAIHWPPVPTRHDTLFHGEQGTC